MKAWALLWVGLVGCATSPAVIAPVAAAVPPSALSPCPTAPPVPEAGARVTLEGRTVVKVCLLGASEDARLRLFEVVAPGEGQRLDDGLLRGQLDELLSPGLVRDAAVFAQPVGEDGALLAWVVEEYAPVGKVTLEGIEGRDADPLRDVALQMRRVSPLLLERAAQAMRELLHDDGFADARVDPRPDARGDVTFVVRRGPRTTVGRITFTGQKLLTAEQLQRAVTLRAGAPFHPQKLEADVHALEVLGLDVGLVNLAATPKVTETGDTRDVVFELSEGDLFRLGALRLSGDGLGPHGPLLKAFTTKPGAPFSRSSLKKDLERLEDLGAKRGLTVVLTPETEVHLDTKRIDLTVVIETK